MLFLAHLSRRIAPLFRLWRLALTLGALCTAACAQVPAAKTELRLESWRKDDQMFWEQKLLPAFHRRHPQVQVTFAAVNYHWEIPMGDTVELLYAPSEEGWYVQGRHDGRTSFECYLKIGS